MTTTAPPAVDVPPPASPTPTADDDHPTHPRTHPWGDPSPLLLLHVPVFFGPPGWVCGRLEWCVAVVLRLLRLCDGMFMQPFAGLGLVVTRSGRCLSWRPVGLLLRLEAEVDCCAGCAWATAPASLRSLGRRFDFVPRLASSPCCVRAGGCSSPTIRASSLRVPV